MTEKKKKKKGRVNHLPCSWNKRLSGPRKHAYIGVSCKKFQDLLFCFSLFPFPFLDLSKRNKNI